MIASQFALLTTDGCGQILDFSRLETYEIGFRLLRIILWSCLIAETIVPRFRAPAWSVFVLLTVGTLFIGSYLAITEERFLSECDMLLISPDSLVKSNILNAVLVAVVTWVRFRSPSKTS